MDGEGPPNPPYRDGPIGLLDSGVGGLSILRALRQELPGEPLLYVADQAHLPYGPRPLVEIRAFAKGITRFLLARGAKIVVVACNAASAASLHHLRETFPHIPFVGMEPAVKPASEATQSGVIGVLTTAATAAGPLYASVLARFASGKHVETVVCPELVDAVEDGQTDLAALRPILDRALAPLLAAGADHIVLGCTHFPLAGDAIRAYVGSRARVVDPSPAIARQTHRVLAERDLLHNGPAAQTLFYTTGDPLRFSQSLRLLLGETATAARLAWSGEDLWPSGGRAE